MKFIPVFGRFHCSDLSWAVEKIMSYTVSNKDLQLASFDEMRKILESILIYPEDWVTALARSTSPHALGSTTALYLIGDNVISPRSAKRLGFEVESISALSIQMANGEATSSTDSQHDSSMYPDSAVAVTGMACKFAGADSLDQLWEILETGKTLYRDLPNDRFPDHRFERRAYPKKFKANTIKNVDGFDHKFFKYSKREAAFMDPQQRFTLQVTYQALESAGYFSREHSEAERNFGCYMAACTNEYAENVCTHPPSAFSLTGSIRPFTAGKVSHHFDWTGPSIMYDTACAASGTAIHQACRAVLSGECGAAVAGGASIFISPDTFQNLAAGHFISTTGPSRSFDAAADGYCRGEGIAVVVLKKLSDAIRDGDPIKGVIASTAVNQNARQPSITLPHAPSQIKVYRKALELSRLQAKDIGYVEAHGTGTPAGDPIETESIRGVFGDSSGQRSAKTYLGSLKSNIGHTEASSGASGLIKVLLMMQKRVIPQQALFNKLNPAIPPLGPDGLEIATKNTEWTSDFKAACVNNYGASGTNVSMIVTQPPNMISPSANGSTNNLQITHFPVSIRAFSSKSLASYCAALLSFIQGTPSSEDVFARNVSYHLSCQRNLSLPYDLSATISSFQELKDLLRSTSSLKRQTKEEIRRPAVLYFPGQTGNIVSVSRALYDGAIVFRKHLDDCDRTLQTLGITSIFPSIFESQPEGDVVALHAKLFSEQYASAMAWMDCGLQPARLIGNSFGQYTAMCLSGVLSLRDALRLVTGRARLIKEYWGDDSGSMLAIEADHEKVESILTDHVHLDLEVACYNAPQSLIVAGSTKSVDALEEILNSSHQPLRWKRLQVTNAFHSALTQPLLKPLQGIAEQLTYHTSTIPLETCTKGSSSQSVTPSLIVSHTREPVHFSHAIDRITEQLGFCIWVEAGSGAGTSLLQRALGKSATSHDLKSSAMNSGSSLKPLANITAELWQLGVEVRFWPFHPSQRNQYGDLNLPPYQFDEEAHWLEWKDLSPPPVEVLHQLQEPVSMLQLAHKTQRGGEFRIDTLSKDWVEVCAEHQLLSVPICPLSLMLKLVSEAIQILQPETKLKVAPYSLSRLETRGQIPAKMEGGLTLAITASERPQSYTFTLFNAARSSNTYTSGTVSTPITSTGSSRGNFAHFQSLLNTDAVEKLAKDVEADSVTGKAVYKSMSSFCQVPSPDQRIKRAFIKGNEAIAYMVPHPNNPHANIETCNQIVSLCLNSLRDRSNNEIYINTGIKQMDFEQSTDFNFGESTFWAVYCKFFGLDEMETASDMFVFDAQSKRLVAVILDAAFTRVSVDSLQKDSGPAVKRPQPTRISSLLPPEDTNCSEFRIPLIQAPAPSSGDHMPASAAMAGHKPDLTQALFSLLSRVADVEVDKLRDNVQIPDLGIDSLMAMEVTEEINNNFSTDVSLGEFAAVDDVGSLCQLIASKTTAFNYNPRPGPVDQPGSENSAGSNSESPNTATPDTKFSSDDEQHEEVDSFSLHSSTDDSTHETLKAFGSIREEFDVFSKETGCDQFWTRVYPSQASLIVTYIIEAFAKLGCDLSAVKAGQRIANLPQPDKREKLVTQLMHALRDDGLVTKDGSDWIRTSKPISTTPSSSRRFNQILEDFPQFAPENKLLHAVGSELAGCLSGDVNPLHLLFGSPEKRKLIADQYTIAPIQSAVSKQLASFITKRFEKQKTDQVVRVLEIGGGTCGTTLYAVSAFAQLSLPVEYTFSDVSSSFISAAKSKLSEYKFVTFRTLDITEKPSPELRGSYDMIIATNIIHATPDVCESIENARQMLQPGGFLTLVEYTRRLYFLDVVFGQLDGWWAHNDGRDHAIMDEYSWKRRLTSTGFKNVEWTRGQSKESEILRIILGC